MQTEQVSQPFIEAHQGFFSNMLRWAPPVQPVSKQQLEKFLAEITTLLHEEHQEDYCGIVYANDKENPSFIKIYDPNNLGVVCGFSSNPPLPGWILSVLPPIDLQAALPQTGSRKRWWQRIFSA